MCIRDRFLTYFASRVITRPIVQMRGVALAIAGGDFSARANETIRGEIGELGRTLNYLAARLDESMTAIILERNRLMQLFDGLNEGILALDVDGNITHANPALYNLMGCDESMPISQLRSTDFLTRALTDVDVIISTRSSAIKQLVCGDKMIRVILSPMLNSREECEGVVVLFSDISESERLEQTRREYVANVSHELKTPVSSLIGLAETLNDNILTEEADRRRYYSLILKESQRLSRLIDDLLELSRLQEGRGRADIIRVNLLELVHESLEVFQQTARESGVTLMVDESFTDCPRALTDPDRVDQVLVILTDNALRFTPRGGWIKYSAAWDETTIRITVEDSGCGIAQKDLPHVFDRFYKADTSYASPGTGLEMCIRDSPKGCAHAGLFGFLHQHQYDDQRRQDTDNDFSNGHQHLVHDPPKIHSIRTVSYTHLDVYKRQHLSRDFLRSDRMTRRPDEIRQTLFLYAYQIALSHSFKKVPNYMVIWSGIA